MEHQLDSVLGEQLGERNRVLEDSSPPTYLHHVYTSERAPVRDICGS